MLVATVSFRFRTTVNYFYFYRCLILDQIPIVLYFFSRLCLSCVRFKSRTQTWKTWWLRSSWSSSPLILTCRGAKVQKGKWPTWTGFWTSCPVLTRYHYQWWVISFLLSFIGSAHFPAKSRSQVMLWCKSTVAVFTTLVVLNIVRCKKSKILCLREVFRTCCAEWQISVFGFMARLLFFFCCFLHLTAVFRRLWKI